MKTEIVGALLGSVPEASPRASHRGYRPSRPRRRRHRSRRSVKNRYGSWVTLPRPRPRPAQLAPAPSATISMEDREKTRERVVSVASQAVGPTAQEDHLQAQVEALQGQVRNLRQAIHMMQEHQISHQQEQQAGYDWQQHRISQLQEELRIQGQVQDIQTQVPAGESFQEDQAFLDAQEPTGAEEAWAFLEEAASRQGRLARAKAAFLGGGGNEAKWTQMQREVTKAKVTRATYRQDRRDPESKLNRVRAVIARKRELDRARVESPTAVPRPPSSPPYSQSQCQEAMRTANFGVCICGYFGDYEQVQEHLAHPNNVGTGHHKFADFW